MSDGGHRYSFGAPAKGWPTFCKDCGTAKDVTVQPCPFESEVHWERPAPLVPLCPACAHERAMDT